MPAPLRVTLTPEEERTLKELRIANSVPYRVRDRAHMLLLNASGWSAPEIAEIMNCRLCIGHCWRCDVVKSSVTRRRKPN